MSRSAEKKQGQGNRNRPFSREKTGKMGAEVKHMRKEILFSFLAGLVLPVALAVVLQRTPAVGDVESDALTPTHPPVDETEMLTVENPAGNLQQMALDEYLVGVVLAEMPADFESEALKAQSVVARTYTRKRMEGSKHGQAAVCMDPGCCQGWRSVEEYLNEGGRQASVDKVRRAVADTDGVVLRYEGKLIDATYFSCSGGSTEDAVAVWGQDVPYLQAVDSPGEEQAPRYSDSVSFTAAELAGKLGIENRGDPSGWFSGITYTEKAVERSPSFDRIWVPVKRFSRTDMVSTPPPSV